MRSILKNEEWLSGAERRAAASRSSLRRKSHTTKERKQKRRARYLQAYQRLFSIKRILYEICSSSEPEQVVAQYPEALAFLQLFPAELDGRRLAFAIQSEFGRWFPSLAGRDRYGDDWLEIEAGLAAMDITWDTGLCWKRVKALCD